MTKRFAVVGMLLGATWPTAARAQFSTGGSTDLSATVAGGGGGEDVGGTGHPGRLAIGISSHARGLARNIAAILPTGLIGGLQPSLSELAVGSASAKYFVTDRIALQLLVGFGATDSTYYPDPFDRDTDVDGDGFILSLGPRALYSVVRGESAELYLGGAFDVAYEANYADPPGAPQDGGGKVGVIATAYVISVPVGFEFAFPGIPALRLSAEMSASFVTASFDYTEDTGADVEQEEIGSATAFILGSPGLDFITLAVHYYF